MEHRSSYTAPRSSRRNTYNLRSWKDNPILYRLVFFILPFFAFNFILFMLVTSSPKIKLTVADTKDYKTVDISFEIKSLLPIRQMTATLESQPIELTKEKKIYRTTLSTNGTLEINAVSLNGMTHKVVEHIAVLDDAIPAIDDTDYVMENGILTIHVEDSQSGINFGTIYATDQEGQTVKPTKMNKDTGEITFDLEAGSLDIYVEDMAGNANRATFSLSVSGIDTNNRDTDFPEDEKEASSKASSTKESSKAKESTKAKESSKAKESTKAKESSKAKESTKASESSKPKESTKASESSKPKESTEATEASKPAESSATAPTSEVTGPNGTDDEVTVIPIG